MPRVHANNFSTTLSSGIDNSQTTVDITSATGFPTIGSGVTANISVQSGGTIEIMTATARSGTTLTVVRGAESTTASSFSSGAEVEIRATAGSIDSKMDMVTPGTSGNVLTSNGTVWESKPAAGGGGGGGGLVKIATATSSSSTELEFISGIDTTYDNYLFVISDFRGAAQSVQIEVSYDNGSTWKTSGGYNQCSVYMSSSAATVSGFNGANEGCFYITAAQAAQSGTAPTGGTVAFNRPSAANASWEWRITQLGGSGYARYITGGGMYDSGTSPPINGVRFKYSGGGTITTGATVTMYGYEK